jgi:hypothetical protein
VLGQSHSLLEERAEAVVVVPSEGDAVFAVFGEERHDEMAGFAVKKDRFLGV